MRFPLLKNSIFFAVWLLSAGGHSAFAVTASSGFGGTVSICAGTCGIGQVPGTGPILVVGSANGIGPVVSSIGPFVIRPADPFMIEAGSGLARFSAKSGFDPVVIVDAAESVQDASQGISANFSSLSTALNGAHSRPLSRLVPKGQKTAWLAGDWGVDNHSSRSGELGLAEFGVGYRFKYAQANIALGKTRSDNDTIFGGSIDADGKFLLAESIIPIAKVEGLYATVSGYYHEGKIDSKRGYLNTGIADFSFANPDSRASGFRVRLDWQDASQWQGVKLSPYLDANFSHAHIDSFTETGGGFPASFNSRDEAITELRCGLNSAMALSKYPFELLANLEIAHRLDDRGVTTTGQIGGFLSGFDVIGAEYDQNWIKAGVGIEGELGKGKASLTLNGTTEGEMPSTWAAFAYQITF